MLEVIRSIDQGNRDQCHGVQPPLASNVSPCASQEQTNENGAGGGVALGERQRPVVVGETVGLARAKSNSRLGRGEKVRLRPPDYAVTAFVQ